MTPTDPVEDFFAHERSGVQPLPTDNAHWVSVVQAHRAARRPRWAAYAAGAAAAIVLAGGVGWSLRPSPDGGNTLPQTSGTSARDTVSSSPTQSATTDTGTPDPIPTTVPTTTAKPTTQPVPADFRLVSLSTASSKVRFGLGTTNCSGHACTQVVRSVDGGATWVAVATFGAKVDTPGRTASGRVGTDTSLTDIRMASGKIGWVFGGGLKITTDGGSTWHDYPHAGKGVVALETDGTQVVLASADGDCNGKTCGGDLIVQQAAADGSELRTVGRLSGAEIRGATITYAGGRPVVSPKNPGAPDGSDRPVIVTDKGLQAVSLPGCSSGGGGEGTVFAGADAKGLFGVCAEGAAAGSTGYAVSSSADGGATWKQVSGNPPLVLANAGSTSFAAADSEHLLAVSGGTPDLHGSMQVSSDGGRTWHEPAAAPPMPDRGWAWVGAPGGSVYYAVPVDGIGGFWASTDRGEHWKRVGVTG